MKGILFNGVHSFRDLNLILSSVDIPPATPKTHFVDIPAGDGSVDLSEALGEIKFKDREATFVFTVFPTDDFEQKKRQVSNMINGQRMKIVVDKDPDYYWLGRCSVDDYASDKNIHQITVKATVEPYKYKHYPTMILSSDNQYISYETQSAGGNGVRMDIDEATGTCTLNGVVTEDTCYWVTEIPQNHAKLWGGKVVTIGYSASGEASASPDLQLFGNTEGSLIWTDKQIASQTISQINGGAYMLIWVNAGDVFTDYVIQPFIMVGNDHIFRLTLSRLAQSHLISDDEKNVITLCNDRKTVVPTIMCGKATTITHVTDTFNLTAGIHKLLNLTLYDHVTYMDVESDGGVVFVYQEGDL